ncbi:dTMP kinase, partial [Rickettsiales bacterium]|nr:dTMP kinase [Rickettsiales bacterium]
MGNKDKGYLITFEGGEGCGKSTQCKKLGDMLISSGHEIILTREPGGTQGAEEIRNLLVNGDKGKWDALTETLLHSAARRDHFLRVIKPAIEQGKIVICDRFIDSTFAYQSYGHGIDYDKISDLQQWVTDSYFPDLTFILDIDIEDGLKRAASRDDKEDRYEKMGN